MSGNLGAFVQGNMFGGKALAHAGSLPPKAAKPKKPRTRSA